MKFYLRLAIIVLVVAIGISLLQQYGGESKPGGSSGASSGGSASTPAASAGAGATQATPSPSAAAPAAVPTAAPMVTPEDTAVERFRQMARDAGVELVGYKRDEGWFVITIRTTDRARLFNFLDVAQRYGLRSIDVKAGPQMREYMGPGGRLIYEATHRMKF
jgi:hypothetical protein